MSTGSTTSVSNSLVTPMLFSFGFCFGLMMALVCLLTGIGYLIWYQHEASSHQKIINGYVKTLDTLQDDLPGHNAKTQTGKRSALLGVMMMSINSQNIQSRLSLQACGVLIGMAFGFLGFALFLIGVKEPMGVEAGGEKSVVHVSLKLTNALPGVVVIICATA